MAKYAAAEAALAALDVAMQAHGGNGLATEYGLLPYWGLARLLTIAPVNREMILNYVAQHCLGLPRSLTYGADSGPRARPHPPRQRRRLAHPHRRGPPGPARGRRRRPPLTYAELDAWVNRLAHGLAARGLAARRRARPRLGQQRRVPRRLLRLREARARLRADQPRLAGRRGRLRARPLAGAAGSPSSPSWSPRCGDACARSPAVADVIVAPRPGAEYAAEPADRLVGHVRRPRGRGHVRPRRGGRRPRPAQLPLHLGHHVVPQGRGRRATSRSTWSRCPAALDSRLVGRRPLRRHDADVPHRAAQRVLHARGAWSAPPSTCMRGFDPAALLDLIERERITQVFGLPMMYRAMLEHPSFADRDLSSPAPRPSTRWRPCRTR